MGKLVKETEKIKRGMPGSLVYVLVPLGFVVLVVLLVFTGEAVQEVPDAALPDPLTQEVAE